MEPEGPHYHACEFHDLVMFRKARKLGLAAASSLGKCRVFFKHLAQLHVQIFNRIGGIADRFAPPADNRKE